MDSPQIVPYRPLPPQRWGFLPTNQFWHLAALTPISLIFWGGASVFFTFFGFIALVWWQQALGFMVFYWVWAGLVERCVRMYLVRRQLRALADPQRDPPEGLADATLEAPAGELTPLPEPPGLSSPAPVQLRRPWSGLALASRVETWDLAYERLFGRGADVARLASSIAFGLAIFHPSWVVKLTGFLALLVASLGLGSWERRRAMAAGMEVPREALEAGGEAPSDPRCDAPGCSPRALPRE